MDDSDIEIILGICDRCNEYVPFLRLQEEPGRIYKCMTCKSKHTQYVNGKVTFNYFEQAILLKK